MALPPARVGFTMPSTLSSEELRQLADLAALEIAESELERLRAELSAILEHVEGVGQLVAGLEVEVGFKALSSVDRSDALENLL